MMDKLIKSLVAILLAAAITVLIAYSIALWPGKYQYYHTVDGILVRINSENGLAEFLYFPSDWRAATRSLPPLTSATPINPSSSVPYK